MVLKTYPPGSAFPGTIGRTADTSTPAWPKQTKPRKGAPNVLFVVLDDTGYGHLGCFGSPIRTPCIDALAADGLRYTNLHTTALCSASRSCILTGRNHHSNHMACLSNASTGYPGSDGYIPFENGFLSEILLQHGYATYCVGKWHLAPEETLSAAGPYDRWPLGRGFERYYGFLGGDTHQYYPDLVRDNCRVEPERGPEQGYHLSEDLVEKAKAMVADTKQVAPDKPFFLYLAFGATHAPHHVPKSWADAYHGQFDAGWERYRRHTYERQKALAVIPATTRLSRRDPDVADWETLSAAERKVYARMMEVFAGFLTHTDHCIGALIEFLKHIGEYDNTLIMLLSDNGSSAEGGPGGSLSECRFFNNVPDSIEESLGALSEIGGPKYFNHFPWGWAHAGNTPFRRWKRETYRGGASDPLIVSWPKRIAARSEIRSQYAHAIDLVPTVLEALDLKPPATIRGVTQAPIEGVSFAHTFDDVHAQSRHVTQYFEMMGHRALYHDGYRAVCPWPGPSFKESGRKFGETISEALLTQLDATGWELYDVVADFSETANIADTQRTRLLELITLWYNEAGKYRVLPIDSRAVARIADERPHLTPARSQYVLYPDTQAIPAAAAPNLLNRAFTITADVVIPAAGADGVLLSMGGNDCGLSFYVQDGVLTYVHNYLAIVHYVVQANGRVPQGHHFLSMEFVPTGTPDVARGKGAPGDVKLFVDGAEVGRGNFPVTAPIRLGQGTGMLVGRDSGATVTPAYRAPFRFGGAIKRVIVDVSGEHIADRDIEIRIALAKD